MTGILEIKSIDKALHLLPRLYGGQGKRFIHKVGSIGPNSVVVNSLNH